MALRGYCSILDSSFLSEARESYIVSPRSDLESEKRERNGCSEEWEYKLDNVEEYLDWESFSEGSNTGEAERLLAELDEKRRAQIVEEIGEGNLPNYNGNKEITSVWTVDGATLWDITKKVRLKS